MHSRLTEVMALTCKHFPASNIDLVTNGLLLAKMSEAFWEQCKGCAVRVAISHYPITLDYGNIKATAKWYGVETAYGKKSRGMYKWLLDIQGGQDIAESYACCFRANQCTVL